MEQTGARRGACRTQTGRELMNYTRQQIEALWIIFLRTPATDKPDANGMFDLGEIHEAGLAFTRMTPYSVAEPKYETTKTYSITI